jgi:hypothetical protein
MIDQTREVVLEHLKGLPIELTLEDAIVHACPVVCQESADIIPAAIIGDVIGDDGQHGLIR